MTLYDIDNAILNCIDPETGDVIDLEALEALTMAREEKIENVALWIKDLKAEAEALKAEEKKLADRRRAAENKAESLKEFLRLSLDGQKFKTARTAISYTTSHPVEIEDEDLFLEWAQGNAPEYLKVTTEISRTAIKQAIEAGTDVRYATIGSKKSITIK